MAELALTSPLMMPPPLLGYRSLVAKPGFNRWLVPPAALSIHLCIGMAYGFSMFWLPLSRTLRVTEPISCGRSISVLEALVTTTCDWHVADISFLYTLFFVVLGLSAALLGSWIKRVGPRVVGIVAAACWCGGLIMSAGGVYLHQLWMLWLGAGVIGGFAASVSGWDIYRQCPS